MSKATEYAKNAMNMEFRAGANKSLVANIRKDGWVELSSFGMSPADALRLRDWLTEMYGEKE